ncbi:hypothetical protein Tco_0468326 [Tanacetum coccineum]
MDGVGRWFHTKTKFVVVAVYGDGNFAGGLKKPVLSASLLICLGKRDCVERIPSAEGDLRKFSDIGAWVQVPRCMAWLNYDEHVDSLSTMDNEVGVTSPESTIQTLPSFEEYTPPEVGLNCNHNTPLSSREVPSFDKPEPQPQPLPNCPPLDASLGTERGLKPPIKPQSPDSFRMKVLDNLTIHTPPSSLVASFHLRDLYCYYRPCVDDPKKYYGFKPGLLRHSGSLGVDFSKLGMIEDDCKLESAEVSLLGRGLNSPVRPKEAENVRINETHHLEHVIFDEKKLGSTSSQYKKGVEGYVRKKRTSEQRKDNEEIRNEVRQQMKEELKSSDFWLEMRAELKVELRNEILAEHNLSPREDDVPSSVELKSSLNSTTNMVRNESQGQHNESFSPRQDHRRLNLSSTKSIVKKEQQGEQNESSSTKPVDVLTSVFKIQCIKFCFSRAASHMCHCNNISDSWRWYDTFSKIKKGEHEGSSSQSYGKA